MNRALIPATRAQIPVLTFTPDMGWELVGKMADQTVCTQSGSTVPQLMLISLIQLFDEWIMPYFRVRSGVRGEIVEKANEAVVPGYSLQAVKEGSPEQLQKMVR